MGQRRVWIFLPLVCVFSLSSRAEFGRNADPKEDRVWYSEYFATNVTQLVASVADHYYGELDRAVLYEEILREYFTHCKRPAPENLRERIQDAVRSKQNRDIEELVGALQLSTETKQPLDDTLVTWRGVLKAVGESGRIVDTHALGWMKDASAFEPNFGIGIEIGDPLLSTPPTIQRVYPGSPAQKAGLRPGDEIKTIEGKPYTGNSVSSLFAVPTPNAEAQDVGVKRIGVDKELGFRVDVFPFVPDVLFGTHRKKDNSWSFLELKSEAKIAYIRVQNLHAATVDKLEVQLDALRQAKARGLILDLRFTEAFGSVQQLASAADLFLPKEKPIGYLHRKDLELPKPRTDRKWEAPLAVLVGPDTGGIAEALAATLQTYGRARVIGSRTSGSAGVFAVAGSHFHYNLLLRTGEFRRPGGAAIQRKKTDGPLDAWGIRPEPADLVPLTSDFQADLKARLAEYELRPGSSDEALSLDDRKQDPARNHAREVLERKLAKD